jgi:hypothetical protein
MAQSKATLPAMERASLGLAAVLGVETVGMELIIVSHA